MKRLSFFAVIAISMLLASCKTIYVQTVNIKSADTDTNGAYKYSDNYVTISYNFWAKNGDPGFIIYNNTDQIIYVDLTKSFFVVGNTAKDYYLNRSFSSSDSYGVKSTAGVAKSAFGIWRPSGYPGSVSASIATAISTSSSKGVTYNEKPIIAIPAHTNKYVSEYCISSSPLQNCSVQLFPNSRGAEYKYSENDMPEFANVITYKVGDEGKEVTVTNKFKITGFTNLKDKDARKTEKGGCNGTQKISTIRTSNPMSFYIIYNNQTDNSNSADGKVPDFSSKVMMQYGDY